MDAIFLFSLLTHTKDETRLKFNSPTVQQSNSPTVQRLLNKSSYLALLVLFSMLCGDQSFSYAQSCNPLADFTFTVNGCDVEFQPYSNNSGISHFWTFQSFNNNGSIVSASNIASPIHTFGDANPGTRTVTHTVTIGSVIHTCTKYITVNCNSGCPERAFTYVVNGCTVTFQTFLTGGIWHFGDGASSTLLNPTHTYAVNGDYIVSYTDFNGNTCRKTIRVACDQISSCCTPAFTGEIKRECSVLTLSLSADCTTNGTHSWSILPNVPNACIDVINFFQGMPTQGMIQISNINTCEVTALVVTHNFTCSNGTVLSQTQTFPIQDAGIFIGENGETTLLTDYNCVLPGAIYSSPCIVYSSGIVTVDKDFTFSSTNVRVHPGLAGFDVIKDFTINQNTLVSGNAEPDCNCLWRGIYIYGANTMTTDSDASIQDALYAIRAAYKNNLNIKKTLFRRNFIDIRGTDGQFNLLSFEENRFDGNGPLKNICSLEPLNDVVVAPLGGGLWCNTNVPYQAGSGFAGLYLKDAGVINLPPLAFAKQNLFYNLAVGIDAWDTELSIFRNSRFENIGPSPLAYDIPLGGMAIRYVDSENKGVNGLQMVGNGKFFAGSPDFNNCIFGIYVSSRVSATVNSGTRIGVTNCRILGAHNGVFLSNNCGLSGTFTGTKSGFPRGGIGNNYIEVNPSTGDLYAATVMRLCGIALTDFSSSQSAPEFWENTVDVNQDEPCGSYGIRASGINIPGLNLDQVNINRNQINVNEGAFGIRLSGYSGAWVHDNSNAAFPGAGVFLNYQHLPVDCGGSMWDYSQGISISSGDNNLVGCNDVFSIPPGNRDLAVNLHPNGTFVRNTLNGGRYGAWFASNLNGTRFACNTMSGYTENGLHYTNGADTDNQGISSTVSHGNIWVNSNLALTDAFINLANTIPGNSQYFVRPLPGENPTTNTALFAWFTNNVPNAPTCYYDCPITAPQALIAEITSGDTDVAEGAMFYNYYPEASQWIDERNLLEKLLQNPGLIEGNSLMTGFKAYLENNAIAQLVAVNHNINNLFAISEPQKSDLESYTQTATGLLTQLAYVDSMSHTTLDLAMLESGYVQRDSLMTLLEGIQSASESLINALKQQMLEGIPAVLTDLESIMPSNLYEANEQYVLGVYLQTLYSGNQTSANTIDSLYNIGRECPMVNGPCVYNARNLYEKFTGIVLPEVDCPEEGNRSNERGNQLVSRPTSILIYPNPANDVLMIDLPSDTRIGEYQVSLFNILGKRVLDKHIGYGNNQVSTKELASGVYFAHILQNGMNVITLPVFIQH